MFEVHQINAGMIANTFYFAGDPQAGLGVLIDPFDGDSAIAGVKKIGWQVQAVINTHGHWDHVGGNDAIRKAYGAPIYAHPAEKVPNAVALENSVTIGTSTFGVLHTPGHRPGHVCLLGEGALFTGDTLFVAGSGNPSFGGNVDQLFDSFQKLSALDDDLTIYPGHNYAEKNLRFSAEWEPGNTAVAEAQKRFAEADAAGATHCGKLGDEKRWNLFFRTGEPSVRNRLRAAGQLPGEDDREVFKALRTLRNTF